MADSPLVSSLTPLLWQELASGNGVVRTLLGVFPPQAVQPASATPYTPADPTDWNPTPTQVAAALDQLAFPAVYQQLNAAPQVGQNLFISGTTVVRRKSGLFVGIAMLSGSYNAGAGQTIGATLQFADNVAPVTLYSVNVPCAVGAGPTTLWQASLIAVRQATQTTGLTWHVGLGSSAPSNITVPANGCNIVTLEF